MPIATINPFNGETLQTFEPLAPEQLNEKLPQAVGLNCWPTTFFIGRDGLVKEIHAGYSGPATGKDNTNLRADVNALVQRLLSGDERAGIGK